MNEPMIEIILNGTNVACEAGHISQDEAARLNQEAVAAAALETSSPIKVTIHDDDIGDEDCRKTVWDIFQGNTYLAGGFSSYQKAVDHCQAQGWVVIYSPVLF